MLENLKAERRAAIRDARAILDLAKSQSRDLNSAENTRFEALNATIDSLGLKIEAQSNLVDAEAAEYRALMSQSQGRVVKPGPMSVSGSNEVRAFADYARHGEQRGVNLTTADEGGYLVGADVNAMVLQGLVEANPFRSLATTLTLDVNAKFATMGALSADFVAEGAAYHAPDPDVFGQVPFAAYKIGSLLKITEEILNDSSANLADLLTGKLSQAIGSREHSAVVSGTGSANGQPTGFLSTASTGLTAASQTAVTADELISYFFSVAAEHRARGTWVMSDTTYGVLRKLKTASNEYVFGDLNSQGNPTILGRPVVFSSQMPAMTAGLKPIAFGDWRHLFVVDRRDGLVIRRLNEAYASTGEVGFRAHRRFDSRLTDANAVKVLAMAAA